MSEVSEILEQITDWQKRENGERPFASKTSEGLLTDADTLMCRIESLLESHAVIDRDILDKTTAWADLKTEKARDMMGKQELREELRSLTAIVKPQGRINLALQERVIELEGELLNRDKSIAEIKQVVNEQADDEALWCDCIYASEAYLQVALRRLHEVIEGKTSEEIGIEVISQHSPGGSHE